MKNLQKIWNDKWITIWRVTSSWTVDRTCLSHPVSNSAGGNAWFPEVWQHKDFFFSFRISLYKWSILIFSCLVVAKCCLFKSLSSNTMMPASVSPSPSGNSDCHGPLPRLGLKFLSFKGAFLLFRNVVKHPDHVSSTTQRHLQHCTYGFHVWCNVAGVLENDPSVEWGTFRWYSTGGWLYKVATAKHLLLGSKEVMIEPTVPA